MVLMWTITLKYVGPHIVLLLHQSNQHLRQLINHYLGPTYWQWYSSDLSQDPEWATSHAVEAGGYHSPWVSATPLKQKPPSHQSSIYPTDKSRHWKLVCNYWRCCFPKRRQRQFGFKGPTLGLFPWNSEPELSAELGSLLGSKHFFPLSSRSFVP